MNTKYIIIAIIAILSANILSAQTVKSYIIPNKPQIVLENGGKVYVKPLDNTGTKGADFGAKYSTALSNLINKNNSSSGKIKGVYNSWYTNRLYSVVNSESEANYIIAGNYLIIASSNHQATEIKETTKSNKIPYYFYEHRNTAVANLQATLIVKDASSSTVIKTIPFSDKKSKNKTRYIHDDGPLNADRYIDVIAKKTIRGYSGIFTPIYVSKKYSFKKVKANKKSMEKADFKATKKDLKTKQKALKVLAEQGKIKDMGAAYLKFAAMGDKIKNMDKVNTNIAYCYELIGNYTKANDYYSKVNDKKSLEQLTKLIEVQQMMKKMGIDVTEEEF